MRKTWEALEPGQREVAVQVLRYAVAGFGITAAFSLAYWIVAHWVDPNVSLAIVFIVFNFVSYLIHGRFSFRGHGARDNPGKRNARFLTVNLAGFALNQFWVWLLVKELGGETWWPTIPFLFVTPWLTFALHRKWVYA
ncbi:GtrA family protein [Sphingomicrobium sediminis]|uniref:GtrA family protein n=1 Tax=Sphingomicrobium sediminis TaxID=2950949 RepID=A0A9X2EI62_9SPHN|nr:GtrA family protein [Sphingomicrobium sediminis]MCM8557946.1 GtrA family protein [Sphingomicrobium sediminis]